MSTQFKLTFDSYVASLRSSGIVEPEDIEQALKTFRASSPPSNGDVERLGQQLTQAGLLTAWQHKRLKSGYAKGFFLGQYKLLRPLGAGGMGSVYLGEHTMMRRTVAIKVVSSSRVDGSGLQRFRRESEVIASLDHPHIVRAHDFNKCGKYHFLVMEFVEGIDLERYIKKRGPVSPRLATKLTLQAAEGLRYAHIRNIVHRDIKPSNLMIDQHYHLKILDLGLARVEERGHAELTKAHAGVLGTVDFIAPEQAMDPHKTDARADIYSLGGTLYFALTGTSPFPEGTVAHRLMSHICRKPEPITKFRKDVPTDLIEICDRMMAKKPETRFQSADEVLVALKLFLRDFDDRAPATNLADHEWQAESQQTLSPSQQQEFVTQDTAVPETKVIPRTTEPTAASVMIIDDSGDDVPDVSAELSDLDIANPRKTDVAPPSDLPRERGPEQPTNGTDSFLGLSVTDLITPTSKSSAGHSSFSDTTCFTQPLDHRQARDSSVSSSGFSAALPSHDDLLAGMSDVDEELSSLNHDLGASRSSGTGLSDVPSSHNGERSSLSLTRPRAAGLISALIVQVTCPHCRTRLAVASEASTDPIHCPKCRKQIRR